MHLVAPHNRAMLNECHFVEDIDKEVRPWIPYLIREMRDNDGMALSANQMGRREAVFVMDVPGDFIRICINPEIIELSGEDLQVEEGCLTFAGKKIVAQRKRHVSLRAFNLQGFEYVLDTTSKRYDEMTSMLMSVTIQHEMDHMAGRDFRELVTVRKLSPQVL